MVCCDEESVWMLFPAVYIYIYLYIYIYIIHTYIYIYIHTHIHRYTIFILMCLPAYLHFHTLHQLILAKGGLFLPDAQDFYEDTNRTVWIDYLMEFPATTASCMQWKMIFWEIEREG